MLKCFFKILPMALFVVSMNSARAADEEQERMEIQQPIIDMVFKEKWSKLDTLFSSYVNGFPSTSNGTHKLILAYLAVTDNNVSKPDGGESTADDWLKANPDSTVAMMLKASSYSSKAFYLRGEGAAETVDEDVWPKFKALIEQEKSYLLKHKNIADKDPMWYQLMISVARNLNDHELLMKTLEEGSQKYPTYQNIYLDAMEGSLPKWGGSPELVEKIAQLAASRTSAQSGKSYYSYVWYNALSFQPEMMELLDAGQIISWETMKTGWHDRYKAYPTPQIATEYMTTACLAQDEKGFTEGYSWVNNQYGELVEQVWLRNMSYNRCADFFRSKHK